MKNIYLFTIVYIFLLASNSFAQPIINIPDATFKSILVADAGINTNLDTEIDSAEAAAYTGGISLVEVGVNDLTGIEAFVNLTSLYASDNNLTSVDLSSNNQLTDIQIQYNFLTSFISSTNTNLINLNLNHNQLASFDASNFVNLNYLDLGYNQIAILDIQANNNLIEFYCDSNQLVSLDFQNNPDLLTVSCRSNNLTSLSVTYNYVLGNLYCSDNPLTCIDVSTNSNLINIEAINCPSLLKLNLKNGMNTFLTPTVNACPLLQCVQVDDSTYSATTWGSFGGSSYFMNDCGQPSASFTHNAPVCGGTPVSFDQTTANIDWFKWEYGDGTINTSVIDPSHLFVDAGYYYVTLTAGNCYGIASPWADLNLGNSVSGVIDHSGGWLSSGDVLLLKYEPFYTSFEVVAMQNGFEIAGSYEFQHVYDGQYLVKVLPDSAVNPNLIGTYSGDQANWETATIINHPCFTPSTMDISMLELPATFSGPGSLSGEIIEGLGFERAQGDPIHGVDVKLGISSSNIVASTSTDTLGQYSFTNVPLGTYTIYVDIAGLLKDSSYTLTIDSSALNWTYLDYLVDSTSIYIVGNIGIEGVEPNEASAFVVYPNPVKDNAIIKYSVRDHADVKFEVYNTFGVKLNTIFNHYTAPGEYLLNFNPRGLGLRSGIYFITCLVNSKQFTQRIVVLE